MRRIIPLFSAFCLLLSASGAFAFGEIMYSDRPLNLRQTRSASSEWVGSLYAGQKVRVAHEVDGWVAVYEPDAVDGSEGGAVGFSNAKYLVKKRGRYEPETWGERVYTPRKLNIRTQPSTKGRKVDTLQPGQRVIIDFPEDDWVRVFPAGATIRSRMNGIGYSVAKYFLPVAESEPAPAPVAEKPVPAPAPVIEPDRAKTPARPEFRRIVMADEVNVHQSRTTSSPMVRTLRPGDVIQVGLASNGWLAVFAANDVVRSESSSLGYSLEGLVDEKSKDAGDLAAPRPVAAAPAAVSATVPPAPSAPPVEPEVSIEQLKAEAVKPEAVKPEAGQRTMVIDRAAFAKAKRPDPVPDQTAHGYRFRYLEKAETREYGEVWITLKVFLGTTKLPTREQLKDFASSLWKEHKRVTKKVVVRVYLPGMDVDDMAWGVVKFDDREMLELWTRRATLFGTKFL